MQTLMNDIQWQQVRSSSLCNVAAPAAGLCANLLLPVVVLRLQRDLMLFGKRVAQPRLIAYMADAATPPYTYSGLTLQPTPWSEVSGVEWG